MLTGWQSSKRICVAEHFEDEQQMSQSQVGEKTGKVVSSAYKLCFNERDEIRVLRGDVYIMKSRGPRTEPWGTPHTQVYEEEK